MLSSLTLTSSAITVTTRCIQILAYVTLSWANRGFVSVTKARHLSSEQSNKISASNYANSRTSVNTETKIDRVAFGEHHVVLVFVFLVDHSFLDHAPFLSLSPKALSSLSSLRYSSREPIVVHSLLLLS